MKFLCMKGNKFTTQWSLFISWGYRNPCNVKDRTLGIGHNRYAVDQFPDYSDCKSFASIENYYKEYYEISDQMKKKYPDNIIVVDSMKFFEDKEYSTNILSKVDLNVGDDSYMPVKIAPYHISATLHGGLGNNLFQMAEVISFCKKHGIAKPFFGTWDLWNGGGKYPSSYNSDRLLGGHDGSHEEIESTFPNLNWKRNLETTYDTKFVINDMFRFSDCDELDYVREQLSVTDLSVPNTASLHLRFCTRPADDHVNGYVDDSFYIECFKHIPEDVHVYIFSDDNSKSKEKLLWFQKNFPQKFSCVESDSFQSLKMMVECEYHILHVSTFSFWSAFLDKNQPNNKVFYPKSFIQTHSPNMIPYKEWRMI